MMHAPIKSTAFKLRDHRTVESWSRTNSGRRSLMESIVIPEVEAALRDWRRQTSQCPCILIGSLAVSYHGKPRLIPEADITFLTFGEILAYVQGFIRERDHVFKHSATHVEVEVIDPFWDNKLELVRKIRDTSILVDGLRIASKEGVVVSMLDRFNRLDQAAIEQMLAVGAYVDDSWPLSKAYRKKYDSIVAES